MAHEHPHSHAPANFNRAFIVGVALNTAYVLFEAIFGFLAHSLTLVAAAGHHWSDVLGLLFAGGASMMDKSLPTKQNLRASWQLDTGGAVQRDFFTCLRRRNCVG